MTTAILCAVISVSIVGLSLIGPFDSSSATGLSGRERKLCVTKDKEVIFFGVTDKL